MESIDRKLENGKKINRENEQRMMNIENLLKALLNTQKQNYANVPDPQVSNYTIQLAVHLVEI